MALLCGRFLARAAPGVRAFGELHARPAALRISDSLSLLTTWPGGTRGLTPAEVLRHSADRPLAVMLPWLGATPRGLRKYADFYTSQGFNVLVARLTARQMLLPETGSQVTARELVEFLLANDEGSEYLVHGFSIGAYYWGEVLAQMVLLDPERSISKKITGMVFDSPADMEQIPVGLPLAISNNPYIQRIIAAYARMHLRWLEKKATRHYRESRRLFVEYPMDDTALLLLWSKNDPVTSCDVILNVGSQFENKGRKVFYKRWPDSKHVCHLLKHPHDYHAEVAAFLKYLGYLRFPERFPAHKRAAVAVGR